MVCTTKGRMDISGATCAALKDAQLSAEQVLHDIEMPMCRRASCCVTRSLICRTLTRSCPRISAWQVSALRRLLPVQLLPPSHKWPHDALLFQLPQHSCVRSIRSKPIRAGHVTKLVYIIL